MTKPLLMPLLASCSSSRASRSALALSWGGDVTLLRERSLLVGLGSFLGAHVAYIRSYRTRSSSPVLATPGRRALLAAGSLSACGLALCARRQDRGLALPVAVYGTTLASMVAAAAAIDPDRGRDRVLLGASLFLLPDTWLGVRLFVLVREVPALEAVVMATYTAGQWCIADGLAR